VIRKNNLDDRTFADIVEEALRLIPRYCPEWTNHNPSDPGMTLVELFAWMTEMTLYRLNRTPEKTYLALLDLMGLSAVPPQASRAVVCFYPAAGCRKPVALRRGLRIAAASGGEELVFETERDALIAQNALAACVNRFGEVFRDYCSGGSFEPFPLFEAADTVEHCLYIACPAFAYLAAEHTVELSFRAVEEIFSVQDETVNYLAWEYWDGRAWNPIAAWRSAAGRPRRDNTLYFRGPAEIAPCAVNGVEAFWLRAVLSEIPRNPKTLRTRGIRLRSHFGGEGFAPAVCFTASGNQYGLIDMNSAFRIFSETPAYSEMFYLACDDIFSRAGIRVGIIFTFSEMYVPGGENEDVRFSWEYWDGGSWTVLDDTLKDGTFGFRQAGEVSFTAPAKIQKTGVNNEEHFWIRVRLLTRDFSLGGEYVKDEKDNWVWRFSSKVHSPVFSRIRITFDAGEEFPQEVFSCTNFRWKDVGRLLSSPVRGAQNAEAGDEDEAESVSAERDDVREAVLFDLEDGSPPMLFLGFQEAFPPGNSALYIRLREDYAAPGGARGASRARQPFLAELFPGPGAEGADASGASGSGRLICLAWEYWNGSDWAALAVNDYTDSFHESGFVEFAGPALARSKQFGKDLYWLRVRFVSGSFETRPVVQAVLLNAVYARNAASFVNEIAGSGTGGPAQKVYPAHGPVLPGMELYVNEAAVPPAKEIQAMRAEGTQEPYIEEDGGVWVRYREVPNFYSSSPLSRHFVVDYGSGAVLFGDGQRGMNPPRGKFNIKLAAYTAGGGEAGNVGAGTLRILAQSIPFVAGCDNPFPAEGGADRESLESLKSRAAGVIKSRGRAVTAEDFEWLAREASASVGRAFCLKEKNRRGEIRVVVIPVVPRGADEGGRLLPSRELLRRVSLYLDERRLVGTKLRLQGPVYRGFSILLTLTVGSDVLDRERLKKSVTGSLRGAFHPLWGGAGAGWEFGKAVTGGAVLKQLEKTEGILSVDEAVLFDTDAAVTVEKLVLKDDELPFLEEVRIAERG
jgi:hypothetical protein